MASGDAFFLQFSPFRPQPRRPAAQYCPCQNTHTYTAIINAITNDRTNARTAKSASARRHILTATSTTSTTRLGSTTAQSLDVRIRNREVGSRFPGKIIGGGTCKISTNRSTRRNRLRRMWSWGNRTATTEDLNF